MTISQLILLSFIQGVTEFLPISSSGHLIILPKLAGFEDQGLVMDVAVHLGTLLAVIIYFWRDIYRLLFSAVNVFLNTNSQSRFNSDFLLLIKLLISSLPVIFMGLIFSKYFIINFRTLEIIGWTTLIFGVLLFFSDKLNMTILRINHISFSGAIFIGLMQAVALIPGTSRSGITMTAARFLGVERQDAARFSMLLAIPAILGAASLKSYEVYISGKNFMMIEAVILVVLSFVFALFAITFLMAWLRRANFTPFVIYRVVLGSLLIFIAYKAPEFNFWSYLGIY
ncbi:MAG: undecaprenyl-diphosphate phosphatase [Rhodospirillaceae bacterium]|nr:undecaprenyl-diphosphate phosphatase [Rhodospirillaceae bacterium]OUT76215.1 MAG: undecaprenyl-diphosphatase [Rhodospirillaceae bacterium TMED23]|tara:strand:- start:105 stop:956 length:852 start_codon:yes stop_codon:yes gene_type:complete